VAVHVYLKQGEYSCEWDAASVTHFEAYLKGDKITLNTIRVFWNHNIFFQKII
jgi:hypothetical protein